MNTRHQPDQDEFATGLPVDSAIPSNINRRAFIIRNAVIGAAMVMTGREITPEARAQQAAREAGPATPPRLDLATESV